MTQIHRYILSATAFLMGLGSVHAEIPVHLDPDDASPIIGELEAISLAVPAEWPTGTDPQEGWQPVYLHGVFEVYVDNNDIGKELEPKPGSLYYLQPDRSSPRLSVATKKDKTDIISVDAWFCKMQLETILLGYIPSTSVDAGSIVTSLEKLPSGKATATDQTDSAITELVGRFQKTGTLVRNRTGMSHKLVGDGGKTLAFVDLSKIPERVQVETFEGILVRITGFLEQTEEHNTVILKAKTLKKAQ